MFLKYPSIENHSKGNYIIKFLSLNPWAKEGVFCVQEKIDGANIQIIFQPNQEIQVAKRSGIIPQGEIFFDVWGAIERIKPELKVIQDEVNRLGFPLRLHGELFGDGICDRVRYSAKQQIKFFDISRVDGTYWSKQGTEGFFQMLYLDHLFVSVLFKGTLIECLEYESEVASCYGSLIDDDNICEGVVISSYVIASDFKIKKKNPKFIEIESGGERTGKVVDFSGMSLMLKIEKYLNENRVISLISKIGPPQEGKDMGKYINLVVEDAVEDYLKDNEGEVVSEEILKKVNAGKILAPIIKKYLPEKKVA